MLTREVPSVTSEQRSQQRAIARFVLTMLVALAATFSALFFGYELGRESARSAVHVERGPVEQTDRGDIMSVGAWATSTNLYASSPITVDGSTMLGVDYSVGKGLSLGVNDYTIVSKDSQLGRSYDWSHSVNITYDDPDTTWRDAVTIAAPREVALDGTWECVRSPIPTDEDYLGARERTRCVPADRPPTLTVDTRVIEVRSP